MAHGWRTIVAALIALGGARSADAQIDPTKRELIQLGYNQPLKGRSPISGYGFYYRNEPNFLRTNITLRLAIAPVYMDSEVGFSGVLGPKLDVGVGLAGGGFADSFSEIHRGKYERRESFIGHGGEISSSAYYLFNPGARIPLYAVFRVAAHYSTYSEDSDTDDDFVVPDDQVTLRIRSGLRWGGREPLMLTELALELSAWYEAEFRPNAQGYGFLNAGQFDRKLEDATHHFWARAMLAYTFPECKHTFGVSLTAGASIDADRFSAYRLGGVLPLISEFPLTLPGYYYQEISASSFAVLAGNYTIPLEVKQRWFFTATAAGASVEYLDGFEQSGNWHSGVGGGIIYRSPTDSWQLAVGYGYGINALRDGDRGAHSVGFLLQFDLDRTRKRLFDPGDPNRSRALQRFFQIFR
jgi:hypothetical protein